MSDLKKPKLASTLKPGVQPNMMHVTGDGKRMYITNSLLSTMDRTDHCWVKLAAHRPDGMKLDPDFNRRSVEAQDRPGTRARHAAELTAIANARGRPNPRDEPDAPGTLTREDCSMALTVEVTVKGDIAKVLADVKKLAAQKDVKFAGDAPRGALPAPASRAPTP